MIADVFPDEARSVRVFRYNPFIAAEEFVIGFDGPDTTTRVDQWLQFRFSGRYHRVMMRPTVPGSVPADSRTFKIYPTYRDRFRGEPAAFFCIFKLAPESS